MYIHLITHIYILYNYIYTYASACAEVSELRDMPASPAWPLPKGGARASLRQDVVPLGIGWNWVFYLFS